MKKLTNTLILTLAVSLAANVAVGTIQDSSAPSQHATLLVDSEGHGGGKRLDSEGHGGGKGPHRQAEQARSTAA